ncbi:hypothetical protein DN757_29480 [Paenibacillus silvae]|uniref:Uncharacterized protein n=1 Tax=Paenibacillus silvae TaxID=1325358 RepID=A0A2W6NAR0_9BACL|nr:hypothetical protein DN757_29480 [Paenibacillus silvae]
MCACCRSFIRWYGAINAECNPLSCFQHNRTPTQIIGTCFERTLWVVWTLLTVWVEWRLLAVWVIWVIWTIWVIWAA